MDISSLVFADRFGKISGSAIREIFKVINIPGMISFAGGNPAFSVLPDEKVSELACKVLADDGKNILQYGATEGYPPFVSALTEYVRTITGDTFDSVLPVTGSTQAMDLLCKALINKGDTILVENPSFLGNIQCMRLYEANLIPVESDENGLIPEMLEEKIRRYHPKMLYTIPTFQNPTGRTLSLERRKIVAELAGKYGMIVAEDDPYRDLRYEGVPLPSIKSFDTSGWVVFLGSFSKIISPGIRVGFMAGQSDIIRKCTIGKQSTDVHTANLNQAIVSRYLTDGLLPDHILRIRHDYGRKMELMLHCLERFPEGVHYTHPQGGLFIWVELPQKLNALELLKTAISRKVAYVPGTHFCVDGGHLNTLRLNFSMSTPEQIENGMTILDDVIRNAINNN